MFKQVGLTPKKDRLHEIQSSFNTVHLIRFFDVWPEESAFWLAREICARDSLTFFVSRLLGSNVPFDQGAEYRGFLRAIAPSSESTF